MTKSIDKTAYHSWGIKCDNKSHGGLTMTQARLALEAMRGQGVLDDDVVLTHLGKPAHYHTYGKHMTLVSMRGTIEYKDGTHLRARK